MKADYKPTTGREAVKRLNELGYPIKVTDSAQDGLVGMIVALAEEIEALRAKVEAKDTP